MVISCKINNNTVIFESFKQIYNYNYFNEITYINCSYQSITSITKFPTYLKYLDCSHNKITKIKNLPKFLEKLICSYNLLTILDFIPNNVSYLDCSNNPVKFVMFSTNLRELHCNDCQIKKLDFLPSHLEKLYCHNNEIQCLINFPNSLNFVMVDSFVKISNFNFISYPVSKIDYNELLLKSESEIISILHIPSWNYDEYFSCMICRGKKNSIRLSCSPIHVYCLCCFISYFLMETNSMICHECSKPFSLSECLFINKN